MRLQRKDCVKRITELDMKVGQWMEIGDVRDTDSAHGHMV